MRIRIPALSIISIFIIVSIFLTKEIHAQFSFKVVPCTTAEEVVALIDTVFLDGVNPNSIRNISFTGDPSSVGYFYNAYFAGFSNPRGIIMTNGKADDADKSNVCFSAQNASTNNTGPDNDPDLNAISGSATHDACIIEFEFKPTSDTVSFNYVFASEEYHDYVFASVNDAFGFFLSGDGINGTYSDNSENIAIVPGTTNTAVSINTVNFGSGGQTCTGKPGGCTNCEYFKDNSQTSDPAFNIFVYDGLTTSLPAKSPVTQCEWYKIKLKIGDGGDHIYDSGVLLEAGSFDPGNVVCNPEFTHPTIDTILYESCNNHEAVLYFNIGSPRNDPFAVPYIVEGAATEDVDYKIIGTGHEDSIYIEPGMLYDSLIIRPFFDTEVEGIEDIQIIFSPVMCPPPLSGPDYDTTIVKLYDLPNFPDTNKSYNVYCEDNITIGFSDVLEGVPPYEYEWYNSSWPVSISDDPSLDVSLSGIKDDFWYCLVTDTCGFESVDTAFVIVPDLDTDAGPDQSMCNQPSVDLEGLSPGAQHYNWLSDPLDPTIVGQGNDTITVSPTVSTQYILVASDNCTNSDQDTAYVTLDGAVANASDDGGICLNDSITLSCNLGHSNETYVWTSVPNDPGLALQSANQTIKVSPSVTTVYFVEVTDDCNYTANDEVEIIVHDLPIANAGSNSEICFGEDYTLSGSGGVQYQWGSIPNDPSLFVNGQDTLANPVVEPDTESVYKYFVTVYNENGCEATDTMELTVNHVPDIHIEADYDAICFGDPVTLEALGDLADDYQWSADPYDASITGLNQSTIITTPDTTTTYSLVATVGGINCPAMPEYTITVVPQLYSIFEIESNITEACQYEEVGIIYTGNGTSNGDYEWDFGLNSTVHSGSNEGPYYVSWSEPGMVNLSLTMSEFGCPSDTVDMDLEIILMPTAEFDADPEEGCAELEVDFMNLSVDLDQATYIWNFHGVEVTDTNATFNYSQPGTYPVSLTAINRGLCENMLTKDSYIVVHEVPQTDFDADPTETILDEATINFINNSSSNDILSYLWYFDDGDSSIIENPVHTYTSEGIYRVYLYATTAFGCVNLDSLDVRIHPDFAVYPPNAFTPNGDGENDTFVVKGTGINSYNIKIFSRWGELIFESDDINDSWDGTYNGSPVSTGTYAYKIVYQSMINIDYAIQGSVTVIR